MRIMVIIKGMLVCLYAAALAVGETNNMDLRVLKGQKGKKWQVDQRYRRAEIVSAHTKWLLCTDAFSKTTDTCSPQPYVPHGYFFETGRRLRIPLAAAESCSDITAANMYTINGCRVKKGLTMVLPVVNVIFCATTCEDYASALNCTLDDPRLDPWQTSGFTCAQETITATLDGVAVDPLDLPTITSQDGDFTFEADMNPRTCPNPLTELAFCDGYPLGAVGPYVFIDTEKLSKGTHELILIGGTTDSSFCSAVKHVFKVV